jgi:hypothetical protein
MLVHSTFTRWQAVAENPTSIVSCRFVLWEECIFNLNSELTSNFVWSWARQPQRHFSLRDAYGDEALSRTRVFERHRWFITGRVSEEVDTRSGWPLSSWNEDNVAHIRDVVREDRTVTVWVLADALNISKSTCHQILWEDLGRWKVSASTHSLRIKRRCKL